MVSFLRIVCLIGCALLFPIFIMLLAPKINSNSHLIIKQELRDSKVYDALADVVTQQASTTLDEKDAMSKQLLSAVEKEFTADYFAKKSDLALDDSVLWITGKTKSQPVISFADAKDNILKGNPKIVKEFETLVSTAKTNLVSDTSDLAEGSPPDISLPDLATLMKNDFSVPIATYLTPVKDAYTLYSIVLPIVGILWVILLLIIILTCKTWSKRLLWLGLALLLSAVSGAINSVIASTLVHSTLVHVLVTTIMGANNELTSLFAPSIQRINTVFLTNYTKIQINTSILLMIAGILAVVFAYVLKSKPATISIKPRTS